ncbi:MAG: PLP-dependent transferase [Gemmatimonadetes bacterium]|nr:PLP-dependent transferase [Gemmatimonadota bacterium]
MRFKTRCVAPPHPPKELAHVEALDLSTTYRTPVPEEAVDSIDAWAGGAAEAPNPVYARLFNPTVRGFEERMTALEDGADSVAFATGMAAISALLLAARSAGSHVVAVPPVYGGTHHLLTSGLLGLEVTWADPEEVASALRPDTALVFVETPANPTLALRDIRAIARAAGSVPLAVDSTFATPLLQRPLRHGAAYSIHSATKFIGGHGDALGGVVTTAAEEGAASLRRIRVATGGLLHPLAAHLLSRGLKTLAVRMVAAEANAQELVKRLEEHPDVLQVFYPGLQAEAHLLGTQMTGPGAVFSVRLEGGPSRADAVLRGLRHITPAVSLGSVDTLIQRPAALTHRILGEEVRASSGIPEDLLRISVGLEDVEDLWEDLLRALRSTRLSQPRQGGRSDPLLRHGKRHPVGSGQR